MSRFRAAVLSVATLCSASLRAQTPDTATLQGTIIDPSHAVVSGAHITATNESTGLTRAVDSDSTGRFTLAGLPVAGAYTVSITKDGFAAAQTTQVQLAPGSTAIITPTLKVAGETSVIIVEGTTTGLRVDQPQLGINLTPEQIQQTPLLNRRITGLPLLDSANRPAINQGDIFMNEVLITTNGAGRRQAWFEVDGANNIDMWGRQTIFTNIPLMAIDSMAVLTNAFTADYGGGTGSVVNIVTRSGSNNYHGQFLELWRPAATEASLSGFTTSNAASGNDITSDTLGQTALAVSGPLLSQKTHFFLAGEWNREAKASPVTSPLAPGSFVGHYRGWLGLLRLDHQINDTNNAFLRTNFDDFTDTNPNGIVGGGSLPTVARTFHRRTYSGELGETATLGPRLVNNLRLQFQLASPITEFDPVVYGTQFVVPISSGGTFTSGTSQNALLMNRQYELSETLSMSRQPASDRLRRQRHRRSHRRQQQGIRRSHLPWQVHLQHLHPGPQHLRKLHLSQRHHKGRQLPAELRQPELHRRRPVHRHLRTGQLPRHPAAHPQPRSPLRAPDPHQRHPQLRASRRLRLRRLRDRRHHLPLRLRHLSLADRRQLLRQLRSRRTQRRLHLHRHTRPGRFPDQHRLSPAPAFPPGGVVPIRSLYVRPGQSAYLSQWFPTSALNGYPSAMLNPYSQQWTAGIEQRLASTWTMSLDYVGAHTLRINRPLDVDGPSPFIRTAQNQIRTAQAANCTRPYWAYFYTRNGTTCDPSKNAGAMPLYGVIQTDVNNGYLHYNALDLNISHRFSSGLQMLASYTWSHTLDNVDPDTTSQNPNDTNFTQHQEYGPAIYDQRHRFVLSGVYIIPVVKVHFGGVGTFGSGLPYNIVTGTTNSGDTGGTTDRPVINGAVIGRNAGRGNGQYSIDPFVSRAFPLYRDRVLLDLRAEAFNVLNHANFIGYSGTYGNGTTPGVGFGAPLPGVTSQLPARSMQFIVKVSF